MLMHMPSTRGTAGLFTPAQRRRLLSTMKITLMNQHVFPALRGTPALHGQRTGRCRCLPRSAASATDGTQSGLLERTLTDFIEKHSQLTAEEVEQQVQAIERLGVQLGANKVVPELNDGSFQAFPISGRLKKVTAADAPLSMGGLTFSAVHPASLQLAFLPLGRAPLFKGALRGIPNAYMLTSAFSVPEHDLAGVCEVVGTYALDADNPQRLHVAFTEVLITPRLEGAEGQGALERWLQLFVPHNSASAVDPATGHITAQLPSPAAAWLDYLVMAPGWQMTRSHMGSVALLRRDGHPHGDAPG